jgi:hypothetical protein
MEITTIWGSPSIDHNPLSSYKPGGCCPIYVPEPYQAGVGEDVQLPTDRD